MTKQKLKYLAKLDRLKCKWLYNIIDNRKIILNKNIFFIMQFLRSTYEHGDSLDDWKKLPDAQRMAQMTKHNLRDWA